MTENTVIGREPIEVIEIDQDFCTRTYGVSPCTAVLADGGRKCFNTLPTCQDVGNYEKGTLTLRFISDRVAMPTDGNKYFPFLESIRVQPGSINPGGGNQSISPLGKRATINISMKDYPASDVIVDPYQAERITGAAQADGVGYDPFERSTFWAKWRARNRYYINREIRYISGYLKDGQIVDSITRTFVLTGFTGPTANDTVTITGKDILTKAQDEKAKAPTFSEGRLGSTLVAGAAGFVITPVAAADDYPASGFVRIADEIMSYTRSGQTFTVVRGLFGTEDKEHDAGDRVQWCLQYSGDRPDDIVFDLLNTYSGIDAGFLDTTGWAAEVDSFMPRRYNALITEPTGVQQLLGEMCEQMYFYVWFDERNDLVKMRAVRPAEDETVYQLGDNRHLVQDSINLTDATDQLMTRVVVNYAIINPARDLDEPSNYAATEIVFSGEEGTDRLDEIRTKVIYSRWLGAADGAAAIDVGDKLLARYSTVPRKVSFSLDAKDRDVWVGDFCQIDHRRAVDDTGLTQPLNIQVMTASESQPGTTFAYMGQEFVFEETPDPTDRQIIISANINNVNLRTLHDSLFAPPVGDEVVTVRVRSGVVIGSDSTASYAMSTGTWPSGVTITLIIEAGAYIVGRGGVGGRGGSIPAGVASELDGRDGGPAVQATRAITINNLGTIGSGGGGCGGGQSATITVTAGTTYDYAGGGGAAGGGSGAPVALPVFAAGGASGTGGDGTIPAQNGGSGGLEDGGVGGQGDKRFVLGVLGSLIRVDGGNGGNGSFFVAGLGQDGASGTIASRGDGITSGIVAIEGPGAGGAAGTAVTGTSFITWVNKGDVRGPEIA